MIKGNCYISIIHQTGAYSLVTLTTIDLKYLIFQFDLLHVYTFTLRMGYFLLQELLLNLWKHCYPLREKPRQKVMNYLEDLLLLINFYEDATIGTHYLFIKLGFSSSRQIIANFNWKYRIFMIRILHLWQVKKKKNKSS